MALKRLSLCQDVQLVLTGPPMSCPNLCRLPALLLLLPTLALAQALVQEADPNAPVSTQVNKCVRAGEIFYTNDACPLDTSPARMGKGAPVTRKPSLRAEPAAMPTRPTQTAPMPPLERMSPQSQPHVQTPPTPPITTVEPVRLSTLKTVRASDLVPPPAPKSELESHGSASNQSFQPLSSFPRLPGHTSGAQGGPMADESSIEAPVRAPNRYESRPEQNASADNGAICGFVQAELERLAEEEAVANTDKVKATISGQQKRLRERQAKLHC